VLCRKIARAKSKQRRPIGMKTWFNDKFKEKAERKEKE
jgi:hypothetical protein